MKYHRNRRRCELPQTVSHGQISSKLWSSHSMVSSIREFEFSEGRCGPHCEWFTKFHRDRLCGWLAWCRRPHPIHDLARSHHSKITFVTSTLASRVLRGGPRFSFGTGRCDRSHLPDRPFTTGTVLVERVKKARQRMGGFRRRSWCPPLR
jgi:hypothetical protein